MTLLDRDFALPETNQSGPGFLSNWAQFFFSSSQELEKGKWPPSSCYCLLYIPHKPAEVYSIKTCLLPLQNEQLQGYDSKCILYIINITSISMWTHKTLWWKSGSNFPLYSVSMMDSARCLGILILFQGQIEEEADEKEPEHEPEEFGSCAQRSRLPRPPYRSSPCNLWNALRSLLQIRDHHESVILDPVSLCC